MNYEKLTNMLIDYNDKDVDVYIDYLKYLELEKDREGKAKNWWFAKFTEENASALFKKVNKDNLVIDGDNITLTYKKKVIVFYNYQAYKNLVLMRYPESMIDLQLVYEGDEYSFKKESGKVIYKHDIADPFITNKILKGCYCIIKNSKGEFFEALNNDDIQKMKNTAQTTTVWKEWEGEMYLKSVLKRACKRHFKDVVSNAEKIDNENYDLDDVVLDSKIKENIENATSNEDLGNIYKAEFKEISTEAKKIFLKLLDKRKKELENIETDDNS